MFKDENRHYSLRKLSVGLASVLIGISFASSMSVNSVKADTVSAQTSAIETKTSENKVNTNADETKEVAKSANSVDSNKITPSQTVLNKQATSNDVLKGTDVKQDAQEPPVKPAVSNKDANIKINSNLNKNTIKQALADSLLKDTTKPETTTLDVAKTSQAPVNAKAIVEDKTQATQNQDWADPAKQGFTKTSAGWTKNANKYDAIANNAHVTFDNWDSWNPKGIFHWNNLSNYASIPFTVGATINKNDIKKGAKILVASVPVLNNYNHRINWYGDYQTAGTSVLDNTTGKTLGNISCVINNNEWDFVFTTQSDEKYAKDLTFTVPNLHMIRTDLASNRGLPSTSEKPYREIYLVPQTGNKYETDYENNELPTTWNYYPTDKNANSWLDMLWNAFDTETNDNHLTHVLKFTSLNKDNLITGLSTRGADTGINLVSYFHIWNKDGKYATQSSISFIGPWNSKRVDDNLTPQQLANMTSQNGPVLYSKQADNSILISSNLSRNSFNRNVNDIMTALQNTAWWNHNGLSDSEKNEVLQATLDHYKAQNGTPDRISIDTYFKYDPNKAFGINVTDVTPNASDKLVSTTGTHTPNGAVGIDTSIYKFINVKYVDETTNKQLDGITYATTSGTDLTKFDLQKAGLLPQNMLFADDQPTTINYGIVKLSDNPDITIHVKHKIVKGVSGDDKMLDNYPNIKKALNASIRLVVNHDYPDNGKFTDENEYPRQYVESIALKRTADVDLTTDSIVSGTVGKWTEASSNNHITFENGLLSPAPATIFVSPSKGYTAYNADTNEKMPSVFTIIDSNKINNLDVLKNGGMFSKSINIVYKADQQSVQVKFVDDDDPNKAQVGDIITVNGVTDGQADFKDVISAYNQDQAKYYVLAKDQIDPNALKHTFITNDSTMLTVHLKHKHQDVTMSDPKAETTAEYRVIERRPAQYGGNKTIIDLIEHYHKQATKDLVTGVTTYGKYVMPKWSFEAKVGKSSGDCFYQIPLDQIVGYTTSSINAPSNEKDAHNYPVLNCFTYTANGVPTITLDIGTSGSGHDDDSNNVFDAVPASHDYYIDYTPNTQTSSYKFVDDDANDKQVGNSVTITGKTDQTVNLSYTAPKNYILVSNQPTTYSFKNIKQANNTYKTNTVPITIHLKHKHQDVTMSDPKAETTAEYRVIERRPAQYGGNKIGVDLVAHAHKTADKDLVTGNITYGNYLGKTTTFEVKAGHPKYANDLSYFNSIKPDKINGYLTMIQNNWSSPERDALTPNQSSVFNHILYFYHNSDGTYALDFMDGNPHDGSSDRAFTTLPASRDFYVDYVAEPQSIQVKFIDQDNDKKQVGGLIKLTGVTDSNADFTSVVNTYKQDNAKHYLFVNTDPSQLSHKFTADDKTIITISLKHQHAKSTVQAPATRTIVVHMPDGTIKTYVQTIGFVNNLDKDLVTNKTTNIYTVDASKSNVTVNGQVSTQYQAYILKDGVVNYAPIKLPHINGYKAKLIQDKANPAMFMVSFVALPEQNQSTSNEPQPSDNVQSSQKEAQTKQKQPEPIQNQPAEKQQQEIAQILNHISYTLMHNDSSDTADSFEPAQNDSAPLETADVTQKVKPEPAKPVPPNVIDLSNDVVTTTPDVSTWQVANEPSKDTYHVSNGQYAVELPHISNAQLHVIANDSTKDSVLFTYKGQNSKYVFKIKFVNGHYLLTTYKIKSGKLVKLIDYNFIKSSKMIDVIVDWIKLK